jgi:hypothetical protein
MILEVVYVEVERVKATTNGSGAFSLLFNDNIMYDLSDVSDFGVDTEETVDAIKKDKESPKHQRRKKQNQRETKTPKTIWKEVQCWPGRLLVSTFQDLEISRSIHMYFVSCLRTCMYEFIFY